MIVLLVPGSSLMVSWQLGKEVAKPGERIRQYRAFPSDGYDVTVHLKLHSIVRAGKKTEGGKVGRPEQGEAMDKDCSFLNHSFVGFKFGPFIQICPRERGLGLLSFFLSCYLFACYRRPLSPTVNCVC